MATLFFCMLCSLFPFFFMFDLYFFFFSSRRRHTRFDCDWSSCALPILRYDDVDELIRIIRHVAESREEWRAKCVNARRLYEARFTWERESAALAAAYRELLGEFTFKTQDRARGRLDGG